MYALVVVVVYLNFLHVFLLLPVFSLISQRTLKSAGFIL